MRPMLFDRFFQRRRTERAAAELYLAAVEQARQPAFYGQLGVPDTLEGRYDMIILHVWMVMRRLGRAGAGAESLAQATVERMFDDMDRNLREMGVTDLRVGKRVRHMAEAFYGRAGAYDKALGEGDAALVAALTRNLYQAAEPAPAQVEAVARYVRAQLAHLDNGDTESLCEGRVSFVSPEVRA
ncbi:MAG: ubiquinol-cytochrome C chaperone family protein [Magnetospirillum sp.]|nr:ubiquinol-cytochrome C chaperone family protein [Magnetospirillum sp.]